jgi:site-specific recombinase XerD
MTEDVRVEILPALPVSNFPVPLIIAAAGAQASEHFLEFFAATIRNKNTRAAYMQAVAQFCRWCEGHELQLHTIRPLHVSAYIESKPLTAPSIKQHLAALRGLFNWLVIKQVVPDNPAMFVKGPRFSRQVGVTPILEPDQMRKLFDSIPVTREVKIARKHGGGVRMEADVKGLRDRAVIAIMAYTFARVGAVLKLKRGDYSLQGKRAQLRLQEKGGKEKFVWLHHEAEQYLDAYLEAAAGIGNTASLFQALDRSRRLIGAPLSRRDMLRIVKERCATAGLPHTICNHTFRGTGITVFLQNGGSLEAAQDMANHTDPRTTKLYDRRKDLATISEIERRIAFD